MKTTGYTIITEKSKWRLMERVRKYMQAGWQPVGGVFVFDGDINQTMIKQE